MNTANESPSNIIIFDGVCNFCNGAVNFIIKRDTRKVFYFSSMQADIGIKLLKKYDLSPDNTDTFLLIRDNKPYTKSDAALVIAKEFNIPWRWLAILRVIPKFIRDSIYSLIANNRYKWFGKRTQCMLPTREQRARFIS